MSRTLFALCRQDDMDTIRRVPLALKVQSDVESMFDEQEHDFYFGRDEFIPFTGSWKADNNELLYIEDSDLLAPLNKTFTLGASAYDRLSISNYRDAGVKAIFMHSKDGNRILIQKFISSQYLTQRTVILRVTENQFDRVSDEGFSLEVKLSAVAESSKLLFENFAVLRSFLNVQGHFAEATTEEVNEFANHRMLYIDSRSTFDDHMDERCRKLIHGITQSKILESYSVSEIIEKAKSVGIVLTPKGNCIALPSKKSELKTALSFLEESVYRGVFSDTTYMVNSKRKVR